MHILVVMTDITSYAEAFLLNPSIKLFTSMRTQDNIVAGKSYFNAEIEVSQDRATAIQPGQQERNYV